MKVFELRDMLKQLPNDMEIVLSKDGEGNAYHKLYAAETNQCLINKYEVELIDVGERIPQNAQRCLVLWPE